MRTPKTMILAFLFSCVAATAAAQAPSEHTPAVTLELQGRIGGGTMSVGATEGTSVPALESGGAGNANFGVTGSIRHYGSGFGVTLGYTHVFTGGLLAHFGLHELDARLSERVSLLREGRFETSLLLEAGAVYATGGGSTSCAFDFSPSDSCTATNVAATMAGGVGVAGIQFRYAALLAGVEVDYRRLAGLGTSAVQRDEEILVMARVGVAFDL